VQLGSLRQLTLVGFALALIPLCVLLWQSQSNLTTMSKIAASEAQYSVDMVRRIGQMESTAIDVERLIRQYHVLRKDELINVIDRYAEQFVVLMNEVCQLIQSSSACSTLEERVQFFNEYADVSDQMLLDAQLAEFRQGLAGLSTQVDKLLDQHIVQQQAYVVDVQHTQAWSTGVLVSISLLLIIFASRLIVRPVEKIERIIGAIARQVDKLPALSTSGPKELIELEQQLHWLADRLNQLEHLRHALLRHASHELKTPLASIKEGCSLLSERVVGPLNDQQAEVLSLLNSSTDRLSLLIEQLLDYNRLLQQAKPVNTWVEVQPLIDAFLTDNGLVIQQNEHQIELEIELEKMYVDEKLFRRILDNLLSNAIAHGSKGRPINIKLYEQDGNVILDVANRGRKIPDEMRSVIFEPFKRGDNKRNDRVVGSGLGLSIVADCARMMHGSAQIVDVDYADVCMRISIPRMENKK
jgi:two-component system, NtrC family, sensor histidine kinase GlrK